MSDCSFDQYWGLLWQLQLAKMLSVLGCQVSWMSSGPDLCVVIGKDCFYVECYSFRKSFGTGEFIRELMARIDPNLAIDHRWWTPYSLPKDNKLGPFLDDLFLPLLDPSYIARLRLQAESKYPVHLPVPEVAKNFNLFMKGEDTSKYDPALRTLSSGIPEDYLVVAFREALGNKRSSNKLSAHRPNLLAVNFLLSEDFQGAFIRQRDLRLPSPSLDFGDELDGVLYSACGINMVPSKSGVFVEYNVSNHPARAILA